MKNLFTEAARALASIDLEEKLNLTKECRAAWDAGELSGESLSEPEPISQPGRPEKPVLVKPSKLPKRGLGTIEGRAALIHAVTHIEFNAIHLGLDAVYRFRGLPEQFYGDWLRVADEEVDHFRMLRKRLQSIGYDYGDFPGHNGLWDMAIKTAHDPMVRMALVPRVLEARGLDVTPGIMKRLKEAGDDETIAALEVILRDEIGHVEIGSRWFKHFCHERGLDYEETFRELIKEYFAGPLRGPFHYEARQKAGFTKSELETLEKLGV